MITQAWVDRVMASAELDAPDVIGVGRLPEHDKKDAWMLKYVARFVEVGIPILLAIETYSNGEHDYDSDPELAADEEMSYWDNDEEPA